MTDLANALMAWGTLLAQAALLAYLALIFAGREAGVARRFGRLGYPLALLIAVAGVAGSLFYSEVAGWQPCPLCWYQRIALYPVALILLVATFRRELARVAPYAMALAALGAAIALYHVYVQFGPATHASCGVGGVSCSETYHVAFGYVSMATASATAFVAILAGLRLGRMAGQSNRHGN
jgi:disulfide bond formation protein DsbB